MYIEIVQTPKNRVNKRMVLKIMYNYKMKENNFKVIYLNVACYRQYIDYFKTSFPYSAPPTYEKWAINMGIQIDSDS